MVFRYWSDIDPCSEEAFDCQGVSLNININMESRFVPCKVNSLQLHGNVRRLVARLRCLWTSFGLVELQGGSLHG